MKYFFILILSVFLFSCSSTTDYKKLEGTWTNGSIEINFSKDNTFELLTKKDSIPAMVGSYTVNGTDIFISFSSGKIPLSCRGEAKYQYTLNEIALNFDLERDDCPFRKEQFAKTFKKIK
ncbi:MAG: hypothetical protein JST55_05360 [Bacteroidetes bacterium]|nr:hypothetical protein [Bacteroidota bacterium]